MTCTLSDKFQAMNTSNQPNRPIWFSLRRWVGARMSGLIFGLSEKLCIMLLILMTIFNR